MNDNELTSLLLEMESDRVERKSSASDRDKIREAICAFANDLPAHNQPGVIFIGVHDNGKCSALAITDELLRVIADMRSDGNIVPIPDMTVQKRILNGCELAVVIVQPSYAPPVRCRGRVWVRVGPSRAVASAEEERRLSEKRRSRDLPFDLHPAPNATLDDLDLDRSFQDYLKASVASEVLEQNHRTTEEQLRSLRFLTTQVQPTVVGTIAIAKDPRQFISNDYIQFLRIDGTTLADPIKDQQEIDGPIIELLQRLDDKLQAHISIATNLTSQSIESKHPDYPLVTLQQLTRNAVMHRNYEGTNAPIRLTWFNNRIEIQNPGGPFGQVTRQNFGQPGITDYRNPHLAEVMKNLGYVQRFGVGIEIARRELEKNSNPPLEFVVENSHILAIIWRRT